MKTNKINQNDKNISDYYIGIDAGTNSVGFAVTDTDYNLCRFKGNSMWGVRLLGKPNTAVDRRKYRTERRRLERRKQRLELLYLLFKNELDKVDPDFDKRMKESSLVNEEKTISKYSLFADDNFNDKDFFRDYKTIYHLRQRLRDSDSPMDVRLVYLALHHILKSRGHFLFDIDVDGSVDFGAAFENLLLSVESSIEGIMVATDKETIKACSDEVYSLLVEKSSSESDRNKEISKAFGLCFSTYDNATLDKKTFNNVTTQLSNLVLGSNVTLSMLFNDANLTKEICITSDLKKKDHFKALNEPRKETVLAGKFIYDIIIKAKEILNNHSYISDYMVDIYDEHRKDIQDLQAFLKQKDNKALYKEIFIDREKNINNYCTYSKYKKSDESKKCTQQEFCSFLKNKLETYKDEMEEMYTKIKDGHFAPKPRSSKNSVIPNSFHKKEFEMILENASHYLPFLNERDADNLTIKEKINSLIDFRIPYYVGPLNNESDKAWVVRSKEKIYPWNFNSVVDLEKSAEGFVINMTGRCSYTGEKALPFDSLLYRKFTVLNEINAIKVNGKVIPNKAKLLIYDELFYKNSKTVKKENIKKLLLQRGYVRENDEISGVADKLTTSLHSYHKLRKIISKVNNDEIIEDLIKHIVIFADDKKLLRNWVVKNLPQISEEDIKYIITLKFEGWGNLSKQFLCNTYGTLTNGLGEKMSIIEAMYQKTETLNQVLNHYGFLKTAQNYRDEKYSGATLNYILDNRYVGPATKRRVFQVLKIVDELVDIKKAAPKKIFIEMPRGSSGGDNKSRRAKLIALYENCQKEAPQFFEKFGKGLYKKIKDNENDSTLNSDKLYFYYLQFGRCMYSLEEIRLEELFTKKWDIDHIFPRSKIKDNSLDNRVLVNYNYNQSIKDDKYPLPEVIRENMEAKGFWQHLLSIGAIEHVKYERLCRKEPLTADELLSAFGNWQLVETARVTKTIADLLGEIYKDAGTKIVYSHAVNVSDFRSYFAYRKSVPYPELIKCREINDHHHAKDAYLNIVVGNYFDTRFTDAFKRNIQNEVYSLNPESLYWHKVKGAWIPENEKNSTIYTVSKMMKKNNIICTIVPWEGHGKLFETTLRNKTKEKLLPKKKELAPFKYGGYSGITLAYFAVVESGEKEKRERSIEYVNVYDKKEYERNAEKYFEKQGLIKPKIIARKVLINSIIELDGVRYCMTGKSDKDYFRYHHVCQLVLDAENAKRLNYALKYYELIKKILKKSPTDDDKQKAMESLRPVDYNVDKLQNLSLYETLLEKLNKVPQYSTSLKKIKEKIVNFRNEFIKMTEYDQCGFLVNFINVFKCSASYGGDNYQKIYGGESKVKGSKKIVGQKKSFTSAYLINQSVTGLYEYKFDLLK